MSALILDILTALALLAGGSALVLGLRRDLMMLQQNSYRYERYTAWMRQAGESTRFSRLFGIIVFALALSSFASPWLLLPAVIIFGACCTFNLATAKYKKPLVMTSRAGRIFGVSLAIAAIVTLLGAWVGFNGLRAAASSAAATMCGIDAVSYAVVIAANWLLRPVQRAIDARYYRDAQQILSSMPDLKVIGITGSYGKTSTKHFLYTILREQFETVMTPGNFNTTLGVVRTVREHLKPYTQVFIVEMGAKQKHDIAEICELVHPTIGIITAVGPQHLESFKTIETVRDTKFELADALPADGLVVVNNDFPMIAGRKVENCRVARYTAAGEEGSEYFASDIVYSPSGTSFTITTKDGPLMQLQTRLVGGCNVSNLIAAVIVALELGVKPATIRMAVQRIEPVEHRLSMRRTPGGVTILDDAYNSNPSGSAMALEVLKDMPGRRIVITPGMIELGDDQERLNREFGQRIAQSADIAIVVGQYNRDAITAGIDEGDGKPEVVIVDSFAQGQQHLNAIMRPGDVILYENDLPDTFK